MIYRTNFEKKTETGGFNLKLNLESLQNHQVWTNKKVIMPLYSVETMVKTTKENPTWLHFGGGNIFRGFIASLQQRLLNSKKAETGIVVVETFDEEIMEKIYKPHDNLSLNVTVDRSGAMTHEVVASVAEALTFADMARLREIFTKDSLEMVSFTITRKGYDLKNTHGDYLPSVEVDLNLGADATRHTMTILSALLLARYQAGEKPIALVSLDNCLENGTILRDAVVEIAQKWVENAKADQGFVDYLEDGNKVTFPHTMIDKMTPYPAGAVGEALTKLDIEDMTTTITQKGTYIAPYVNSERYFALFMEDRFPGKRPALEEAGVKFGRRSMIRGAENLKVSTCLSPLHTATAIFGSLLGIPTIGKTMEHDHVSNMVKTLGYLEGLPVARGVKNLDGKEYLDTVYEERLPNVMLADVPSRITRDCSEKMESRFGLTVKATQRKQGDVSEMVAIPLVVAGWFRYLMAVDDNGNDFVCSPDPMLEELQSALKNVKFGQPESYQGELLPYLTNKELFGVNYVRLGLSEKIEGFFVGMLRGEGAVNKTLFEAMIPVRSKLK